MLSQRILSSLARQRVLSARTQPLAAALRFESSYASTSSSFTSHDGLPFPGSRGSRLSSRLPSASSIKRSRATDKTSFASPSSSSSLPDEDLDTSSQAPAAEVSEDSFRSLKGLIQYPIYKALVQAPFKFETMSEVQKQVLGLLPELAEPAARGAKPVAAEADLERDAAGAQARGNRQISSDLLVKAKTGTGKTVAFLVPALEARAKDIQQEARDFKAANPDVDKHTVSRHMAMHEKKSVGTVILSPTRELATQIANEAVRMIHHNKDWGVQLFIGGASKMAQERQFRRGRRDVLVATPGRLIDMLQNPEILDAVSQAKVLIFDEADTLLDMGFRDQIKDIVETLPPKSERQTFMFSATVSKEVQQIAKTALKADHTFIDCVPANETNTHLHIPQYHTVLPSAEEQIPHVFRLLAQDALLHPQDGSKVIIFLPTTKQTELFASIINNMRSSLPWGMRNTNILEMHSKKTQSGRDRTAEDFREAKGAGQTILVTSDISARGVDYPGVTRVIQIGIPPSKENYVHRLGRTGRAGKAGRGDIVLLPWERDYVAWQLQDMPLNLFSTSDLQAEVEKLAEAYDTNPTPASNDNTGSLPRSSRFGNRRDSFAARSPPTIQTPTLPRIQGFSDKLREEVMPGLSEQDVSDAFASAVGFYMGHAHEMHTTKEKLIDGLRDWTTQAMGLEKPPYLSPSFLQKCGVRERSRSGKGAFGGASKRYTEMDRKRDGYEFLRNSGRSDFGRGGSRDRDAGFGGRDNRAFGRSDRDRGGFGGRSGGFGSRSGGPSFRRASLDSDRYSRDLPF